MSSIVRFKDSCVQARVGRITRSDISAILFSLVGLGKHKSSGNISFSPIGSLECSVSVS